MRQPETLRQRQSRKAEFEPGKAEPESGEKELVPEMANDVTNGK